MELIAYLIGLIASELAARLPGTILGGCIGLIVGWIMYRVGRRAVINADYREDIAKAEARRRARL